MKVFFQKHIFAIYFAFIVGCISVLPTVLAPLVLGSDYKGVQFLYLNDENIYRARIHEVLDGHPMIASPQLYEYKNDHIIMPPINEYFYALPALLFGLSFVTIAAKFLFPALLFFLAYILAVNLMRIEIKESKWVAVTSGLLVIFGVELVNYNSSLPLLFGASHDTSLLLWTRPVNPIIGALEVFSFLILLSFVVMRKYRYAYLGAGVILATTVGYFFSFGISISILSTLTGIYFLRKDYVVVKELCYVIFASFVLDAAYWYNIFTSIGGEEGRIVAERNGMYFTHAPVFNKILFFASLFFVASFVYAYFLKKDRGYIKENIHAWLFMLALLLGSWIAFNQQVITGRTIWYHHFVQYSIPLALFVCVITSFFVWRRYFRTVWFAGMIGGFILCLWMGIAMAASFVYSIDDFRRLQNYAPLFAFFDSRASKDCVVLIKEENWELEQLIPAYTHCDVYSTTSTSFGISKERILHNYLLRLRLNEVDPAQIHEYLMTHQGDIRLYFYSNFDQIFGRGDEQWIRDRSISLEKEYQEFIKGDLVQQLQQYRIDYLISKEELPISVMSKLTGLKLMNTQADYYFYSFDGQ